jgi:Tfp pilus assembly protein PilZ
MPYHTGVKMDTDAGLIYGTTRNIGSGGLFVETKFSLPIGQKVELKFKFRSGSHFIRLPAQVVRGTSEGLGLRLL